jgi:methionyl-tRNA formyltransferase
MSLVRRIGLIGSGAMLGRCIHIAEREPDAKVAIVLTRTRTQKNNSAANAFCKKKGIPFLTYESLRDSSVQAAFSEAGLDLLISVYNPDILKADILDRVGVAINFHDSELPKYAGRHAVSWAILNGERQHGVTWHVITPVVDGGDIVSQTVLSVSKTATALSLAVDCIGAGCAALEDSLGGVLRGDRAFHPQDLTKRSYYSAKMKPFDGKLPLSESYDVLERLARATDYYPAENPFFVPKLIVNSEVVDIVRFRVCRPPPSQSEGIIVGIDEQGVLISARYACIRAELICASGSIEALPAAQFASLKRWKVGDFVEIPTGAD